jgi:L-ribulose-5-phosphate 3-epimerase
MSMVDWEVGVMACLRGEGASLQAVADFGLRACQLVNWDEKLWDRALAEKVRAEAKERGIRISALWAGVPGPEVWDFVEGPQVLGLVPAKYRRMRIAALKKAAPFAKALGVPAVITHLGFIPENPGDPLFAELVDAVREVAGELERFGLEFWFETGQETPVTMLRTIETAGTGNLGINLDPANLILYGKANPVDALAVFGSFVRNVHAKDGFYPTDPMKLGREVPVGEGVVDFPRFLAGLRETGYKGELIIEREIEGEEQRRDIVRTVDYLRTLVKEME